MFLNFASCEVDCKSTAECILGFSFDFDSDDEAGCSLEVRFCCQLT